MKALELHKIDKNGKKTKCKYFKMVPLSLRTIGSLLLKEKYIKLADIEKAVLFETPDDAAKNLYKLITKRLKKDLDTFTK